MNLNKQQAPNPTLTPLMRQSELDFLSKTINSLPDDGKIIEWGSGGSTLWFLDQMKPTQYLYSIEHNPDWFGVVNQKLQSVPQSNYSYIKFTAEYSLDFYSFGTPNEEFPCGLDQYINPKLDIWDADLFFVDGIARGAVLVSILMKSKKPKPFVFIHDYRGREFYYDWATQFYTSKELVGDTLLLLHK